MHACKARQRNYFAPVHTMEYRNFSQPNDRYICRTKNCALLCKHKQRVNDNNLVSQRKCYKKNVYSVCLKPLLDCFISHRESFCLYWNFCFFLSTFKASCRRIYRLSVEFNAANKIHAMNTKLLKGKLNYKMNEPTKPK